MPFQVIYSEFSRQPGIINSFDAGADIIAVCDLQVTLTATVDGDLFGHTIVWEQVSGAPVTFITPTDQLSVTYVNAIPGSPITGGVFDDKVFRFIIDKNSTDPNNPEQFDDVNVFGAPTSFVHNSHNTFLTNQGGLQAYTNANVPQNYFFVLDSDGAGCNNTAFDLRWSPPTDSTFDVVRYEIEEYTPGSGFAVVGTTTADYRNFQNIILGRSYRVLTYLSNGAVHVGPLVLPDPTEPVAQDTVYNAYSTPGAVVSNFDLELFSLISCEEPELSDNNVYDSYSNPAVEVSNYTVELLTLITCTEPELDDNDVYDSYSTAGAIISNFDVIDLDGGQVGG